AGEEPEFVARRIMICAAEDVGNADPQALQVAVAASAAAERIGMPESQIILAQAAEYVATAPKSNTAVMSIEKANELNERYGNLPIPPYLQDAHYSHAKDLGHGIGYEYAHIYEGHYSGQPNLPEAIRGEELYQPSENGYEQRIRAHMSGLTGKVKYARPEDLMPRDEH
ncbi:MAG: replication-associated recombination protein A, partial [Lachnospiraceae bacterium]|nr:replication-associated recombination protein A [Lachnospiraceae bacterium]